MAKSSHKRLLMLFLLGMAICFYSYQSGITMAFSATSNEKSQIEEVPSWIYPRPFKYNPKANPDIFRPFINPVPSITSSKIRKKKHQGPLTPLEKIQPSQLKLVGIVTSPRVPPMALVELPNGKGYILRIGTKVGINDGKVIKIGSNFVVIQEKVLDIFGKEVNKNTILKLHTPQGGGK